AGPLGSTRFPYTTLFRSEGVGPDLLVAVEEQVEVERASLPAGAALAAGLALEAEEEGEEVLRREARAERGDGVQERRLRRRPERSEEHTSELQSRENLVC